MPKLTSIPDYSLWIAIGVLYLSQAVANGTVKSFQTLKDNFVLPNHMFFRYLQLRHALNTQFRDSILVL